MGAGGSGVDVEQVEFAVVDYLEYMAVAGHHQSRAFLGKHAAYARGIASGIAADVGHEHFDVFALEGEEFGTTPAHHSGVDVATDSAETRADGEQTAIGVFVADVAGVLYLVAVGEMDGEAVIPARMCVGQYAYFKHCFR